MLIPFKIREVKRKGTHLFLLSFYCKLAWKLRTLFLKYLQFNTDFLIFYFSKDSFILYINTC